MSKCKHEHNTLCCEHTSLNVHSSINTMLWKHIRSTLNIKTKQQNNKEKSKQSNKYRKRFLRQQLNDKLLSKITLMASQDLNLRYFYDRIYDNLKRNLWMLSKLDPRFMLYCCLEKLYARPDTICNLKSDSWLTRANSTVTPYAAANQSIFCYH